MQNETQNQDTQAAPQQPAMEEAPAAPQQAMNDTQATTSEVHDIPQQEQQGIAVGESDPGSPDGDPSWEIGSNEWVETLDLDAEPMSHEEAQRVVESEQADGGVPDSDGSIWDSYFPDTPEEPLSPEAVSMPVDKIVKPVPNDQAQTLDSEAAAPLSPEAVSMPVDKIVDPAEQAEPSNPLPTEPTNTGVVPPWLQEPSGPFSDSVGELGIDRDGNGIEDRWEEISPTVSEEKDPIGDSLSPDTPEEPTPGGYDDMLGISKEDIEGPSSDTDGPGIDQDGMPENTGINPDMSGENYTYDEGAYEDAQDAFEDLQDALQDGDEEDRAEALEELRDYLNGFDKDNEDRENDSHNPGDQEDEHHENQRPDMSDEDYTYDEDAYEDAEGALKDLQHALKHGDEEDRTKALEELQGYLNGFNKDNEQEEDYTYDEDAYKDAEGALKDLQHALKHGDEQERAEALEKLQGYLGGFGKGDEEEDRDGTETQDGKIPNDSKDSYGDGVRELFEDSDGDGVENYKDSDHYRDGNFDFEDSDGNGILDLYEDSDGDPEKVPNTVDNKEPADAPDASGAAVSGPAAGAAGAAVGAGAAGEAGGPGGAVGDAKSLIGDMLGGSWDAVGGATNAITKADGKLVNAGEATEAPDASGAAVSGPAVGAAGAAAGAGAADQAMDAATAKAGNAIDEHFGVEGSGKVIGDALDGNWGGVATGADKIIQESTGISGVGDTIKAISEEKWEELPGEFGETAGSAVGAYFGGDAGAAVGAKIGQEVGDLVEDGIDALEDAWDSFWD